MKNEQSYIGSKVLVEGKLLHHHVRREGPGQPAEVEQTRKPALQGV